MIATVRGTHADNANRTGLARRIRRRPILDGVELRRQGGRHQRALKEAITRQERAPQRASPPTRDARGRFVEGGAAAPAAR
jgi:hypothetical protein